jgi:hypothetical protein
MIIQLLCLIFSRVFDLKAIWACWALYIYGFTFFIYLSIDLFIHLIQHLHPKMPKRHV